MKDVQPTHLVKIMDSDYNKLTNQIINVIGSKRAAIQHDAGYDVLCEDGVYRYMSVLYNEIEVVGTINY